jgi:alpha-glucosidase
MIVVDPGIKNEKGYSAYDEGNNLDIWIKNKDGKPFIGKVWPGEVVFEDWFAPAAEGWWTKVKFQGNFGKNSWRTEEL